MQKRLLVNCDGVPEVVLSTAKEESGANKFVTVKLRQSQLCLTGNIIHGNIKTAQSGRIKKNTEGPKRGMDRQFEKVKTNCVKET